MAQPVTPQDHIAAAAQRVRDQQTAAKELALKDRKSTRLNSSHRLLADAVVCV